MDKIDSTLWTRPTQYVLVVSKTSFPRDSRRKPCTSTWVTKSSYLAPSGRTSPLLRLLVLCLCAPGRSNHPCPYFCGWHVIIISHLNTSSITALRGDMWASTCIGSPHLKILQFNTSGEQSAPMRTIQRHLWVPLFLTLLSLTRSCQPRSGLQFMSATMILRAGVSVYLSRIVLPQYLSSLAASAKWKRSCWNAKGLSLTTWSWRVMNEMLHGGKKLLHKAGSASIILRLGSYMVNGT